MNVYEGTQQQLLAKAKKIPVAGMHDLTQRIMEVTHEELSQLSHSSLSPEELTDAVIQIYQFNMDAAKAMHEINEDHFQDININVRSAFRPDYQARDTALQLMLFHLSEQIRIHFSHLPQALVLADQAKALARVEDMPYYIRKELNVPQLPHF